ncbi:cyclin-L2-like isoform X2 [Acipenser ruthenus]|uniref:cyclin-L2-like n=1 Tax=Acipenser ruthenus TaxID=7906 RepID=UPI001561171D|nr:cyclin-L2-like [Acipenser ruthenus]XP_058876488.1 cyclin-L2-like isoform X2 [Acipenser ruthenus]
MAAGEAGFAGTPAEGILIGEKRYSGVKLTLDNCLLPRELLSQTPSAAHGLRPDTEAELRREGCELIQAAGILLKLPQVAMATGQILFQRFFYCKSFVKHSMEYIGMACLHLASKIEEEPRRVRDVLNVFHRLRQIKQRRKLSPLPLDVSYIFLKNQVIKAERRVLKELGFCVHVKHPHKIIVMYIQVLELEKNKSLVQTAWNYMNDSLRTDVFVRFDPESIACACVYLAARALQIPLPNQPHWFLLFGVEEEGIREICQRILQLYLPCKTPLSSLEQLVQQCRLALDEARTQTKRLLPNGTPKLETPAGFSPASKTGSPVEGKAPRRSPLSLQAVKNLRRRLDEEERRARSRSPVVRKGRGHSAQRSSAHPGSPARSLKRRRSRSMCSHSASSSRRRGRSSSSPSRSRSDSPPPPRPPRRERRGGRERRPEHREGPPRSRERR